MKRRTLIDLFALSIVSSLLSGFVKGAKILTQPQRKITFYIAPNGQDRWSGKLSTPNAGKTDGPFATLKHVQLVIRHLKQKSENLTLESIVVMFRQGTYYLTETAIFTAQDGGNRNLSITYQAYPNERVIISGGKPITGWQKTKIDHRQLWVIDLPDVQSRHWYFRQLWSQKTRLIRARYPHQGYLKLGDNSKLAQSDKTRLRYQAGDLKNWNTIDQSELVVMSLWRDHRFPINKLVESNQEIWSDKLPFYSEDNTEITKGELYYLEGCLETLDSYNQWFLDKKTGKLYYFPSPEQKIRDFKVIAPILSQLIRLDGANYLNFQGLTFSHTDWYYDNTYKYSSYPQSGQKINPISDNGGYAGGISGAIYAIDSQFCQWNNCTFSHLGGYGLEIADRCVDTKIINCQFNDLGAGGIILGKNQRNQIRNCQMNDLGIVFHTGVGIFIADSSDNYIANNHIHHLYYSGISVGWIWGYGKNQAHHNIIESNHIHDLGITSWQKKQPILNDKGGIYLLGVQPGTIVRNNRIHHIDAWNFGAWGIYLDAGSSNILVENNLVYQTRDGGFHQHFGKENTIRNNIFAYGKVAQIRRSRAENHHSFTFERNIIYWESGKLWDGSLDDLTKFKIDKNLYWTSNRHQLRCGNLSWQEWQAQGLDRNSLIADPQFVDPQRGDFRLNPRSPAVKLGFKPLQMLKISPNIKS